MLTCKEARAYLKVSSATMSKWLKEGSIPAHRLGRGWRFYENELDEWLRNGGPTQEKAAS